MRKQINRVAMDSSFGSAVANIFVEYYEEKLFQLTGKRSCIFATLMTPLRFSTRNPTVSVFLRQ